MNAYVEGELVKEDDKFQSGTGELIHVIEVRINQFIDARVNGSPYCLRVPNNIRGLEGIKKVFGKRITDQEYKTKLEEFWSKRDDFENRIE